MQGYTHEKIPASLVSLPEYLKMRDLCALFGISPTAIRNAIRKGAFPSPVRLTSRTHRWLKADVLAYLEGAGND